MVLRVTLPCSWVTEVMGEPGATVNVVEQKPAGDTTLQTFTWNSRTGGALKVVARAYDENGIMQDAPIAPPFPDGASGHDAITVLVSG